MPEIEITEDQHEYLQALREDIKQDVVGRYAHVRTIDAVQYLIDNHEGEINATVTAPGDDAGATDAGASSGGVGDHDAAGGAVDGEGAPEESDDVASDGAGVAGGSSSDGDAAGGASMAATGNADDDGMLSAMMQLLETHDDKWQSADGDTGYQVELPDGSTEAANTRDDVRALLFQHYE